MKHPKPDYDDDSFVFKVSVSEKDCVYSVNHDVDYLVDCGATTHIITDPKKFIKLDENFNPNNHVIELADCSRKSGLVTAKGDAQIKIQDSEGKYCDVVLKSALCIPTYQQNILSVHAMTEKGLKVVFTPDQNDIITPNGTIFNMKKSGKLYFLKNVQNIDVNLPNPNVAKSLEEWHCILGHCNIQDV